MTQQEYISKVWSFYLRLENEFIESLNYVEFSRDNYSTYSVEFERLLLAICAEVDVLCKLLCREIDATQTPSKILEYGDILCNFENFVIAKVRFERSGQEFTPFSGLSSTDSPSWWKAYNKVKHERTDNDNYKKGNLENVFMSLAALYMVNRYYCRRISTSQLNNEPTPRSQLFNMVGWPICIPIGNGFFHVLGSNGHLSLEHE